MSGKRSLVTLLTLPSDPDVLLDIGPERFRPLKCGKMSSLVVALEKHHVACPSSPSIRDRTELIREVRVTTGLIDIIQLLLFSICVDAGREAISQPVQCDVCENCVERRSCTWIRPREELLLKRDQQHASFIGMYTHSNPGKLCDR